MPLDVTTQDLAAMEPSDRTDFIQRVDEAGRSDCLRIEAQANLAAGSCRYRIENLPESGGGRRLQEGEADQVRLVFTTTTPTALEIEDVVNALPASVAEAQSTFEGLGVTDVRISTFTTRPPSPPPPEPPSPERGQCGCPAHTVCGMCVDEGDLAAAEQAAVDLETRFHASTNVVMDLDRPEDETAALLQRCVHVSGETKRRLMGEWSEERMAHALPLHACASFGVRDPSLSYARYDVSALPRIVCVRVAGGEDETRHDVFELSPEQRARYQGLQNKKVRLAFPNGRLAR